MVANLLSYNGIINLDLHTFGSIDVYVNSSSEQQLLAIEVKAVEMTR